MKRHKREILRFIFAIAVPAVVLAVLGIFALRTVWVQTKAEEQSDLNSHAQLICELMRSEARLYGFDRHDRPGEHDDGGPGAHMMGKRPPGGDAPPLHDHKWADWQIAVLPGICGEIAAKNNSADDALVFAVDDKDGRRLYSSSDFPVGARVTGTCELGPPLLPGTLTVARADGGAAARSRAIRLVAIGGCIVVLLVASLLAAGVYFVHTLHHERQDALRKTDFLDNISHELKTPLAGIRLNAELLEQGRIGDERLRRGALEAILIESDRLTQMVDKLLNFSRIEKGTYRYDIEEFDLAEFIESPSETQGIAAISQGRATVRVAGACAIVAADKNAVRQIGINLVTNAMKYTEGPIEIEATGNELRYLDRGPGLPPGDEERVFERFYRADNSLTNKIAGSGLGLAIARSLARGMGGDVTYSHRPGGGSIFTLKLKETSKS